MAAIKMNVPSARPFFNEEDIGDILNDIKYSLRTGILTLGPKVKELEELFAEYIGVKYAIAVNSGTSALEIALRYFDVRDKEVIVPTNSFIASANAVFFAGGRPVLADIKRETLCINPDDVLKKITPKTKGVIVVHLAGLVCPQMKDLQEICEDNNLFLIEDAAHAHGAMINSRKAGSLGDAGCFSFFPTKVMTTGEGGMITTDDDKLSEIAKSLRHHGAKEGQYERLGYNWRMSEINAILGIYQLKRLDEYVEQRNKIAQKYADHLMKIDDINPIVVPPNVRHSYYKYPVLLSSDIDATKMKCSLKEKYNIDTGSLYYPPIHLHPLYKRLFGYTEGMLPVSEKVLKKEICLPMFVKMDNEAIDYVIRSLEKELQLARARRCSSNG